MDEPFTVKDHLQIVLITYNRDKYLKRTLNRILDKDSPIRDFPIIIFDNCSSDGTADLIALFQASHPNISCIRHRLNISGNANIVRALESCEKDYLWIICDDDKYDWTGWPELVDAIHRGEQLICACTFDLKLQYRQDAAYLLNQMTFLPSNIYSRKLLTEAAIRNCYDNIYTMFPHLAPVIMHLNNNEKPYVLAHGLVHPDNNRADGSFIRGYQKSEIFARSHTMTIPVGFSEVITNLASHKLAMRSFSVHIAGDFDRRMGWLVFFRDLFIHYRGKEMGMHYASLYKNSPRWCRPVMKLIHLMQNTPLHPLLLNSPLYTFLKRRALR